MSESNKVWTGDSIWKNHQNYMDHLLKNTFFREAFDVLKSRVQAEKPKSVLDIGSGFGYTSVILSDWLKVSTITSSDPIVQISEEQLKDLALDMNLQNDKVNIQRRAWKFEDIGALDVSWDMIVAVSAIHHSHELYDDLESLYNGLNPGGVLILANEIIYSSLRYRIKMFKKLIKIIYLNLSGRFDLNDQLLAQGRFKYNSNLGDWTVSRDYYCFLAKNIGFNPPEFIRTEFVSYKQVGNAGNDSTITHVILTKP